MNRTIRVLTGCLLLLSPLICRAEKAPVTHNFQTLASTSKLAFFNSNHVGKTDLCTYTCTSGSVFGLDFFSTPDYNKKVSINYSAADQVMTTTAIDSLAGLEISYYYQTSPARVPYIEVRLSRDSVHWSDPIVTDGMYDYAGRIRTNFVPGRYYVRLTSKNSNQASLFEIIYYFGGCNCFLYIPE